MPVDIVISPPEESFWTEMHESEMKLKIRVRRMKEGRELRGGFAAFSSCFPGLCEGKPAAILPMSISQPCMPVANVGPTRILPHLYLGSQKDVLNKDLMAQNDITYVLNASNTCPKPDFICESHFMRIPVNDNYCEKLLPWLDKSNDFIDKAKVSNCRVIVHCLAGISRSATIAIAYIMKTMGLSSDDAYRFVKDRRPSISPNFNFLGQLLEFEKGLKLLKAWSTSPGKSLTERHEEEPKQKHAETGTGSPGSPESGLSGPGASETEPRLKISEAEAEPEKGEAKLASPTSLQQGLIGLHLSTERILDTNRLKRSFSLDIKSAYSPSHCPRAIPAVAITPMNSEDIPKLCKLDSPGTTNGFCQFSPVLDSPGSSSSSSGGGSGGGGDSSGEARTRQRRKGKHNGSAASSPAHSLSLNFSRTGPVHKSPSLDENLKASLLLSLPNGHQPLVGSNGVWTNHRETVQATTPGTPTGESPWYFGADSPASGTSVRFGSSSAYMSFGCSALAGSCEGVRLREKHEDSTGSTADKQFKRRSCQMEFEDGISETRSREELGKIGKQSSFSGSMEIIEVS